MKKSSILITSYYPPISYIYYIVNSKQFFIDAHEHYDRQTIRNRCYILSPNGIQFLSIPIIKSKNKNIKDIEIDYSTPWNSKHAHAIRSAYGKSPFFCYYYHELIEPLFKKHKYLFDLNNEILNVCLKLLNFNSSIQTTNKYKKNYSDSNDLRKVFSNNKKPPFIQGINFEPYIQCFSDRFNFVSDLSILDLLFNKGFESYNYLKNQQVVSYENIF